MDKNKKQSPSIWERLVGTPSGPTKAEAKPKPKPSDYDAMGNPKKKDKGSIAQQINWPNAN